MPFKEAVVFAFASLWSNKLRSFLTLLGVLIGVAAVIAIVAITEGLDGYISNQVLDLGSKSFSLQKMPDIIMSSRAFFEAIKRKDISLADLDYVRRQCEDCAEVGGELRTSRSLRWRDVTQEDVEVRGVTENMSRIGTMRELLAGRYLVEDDVRRARPVAVVGADIRDAFFAQIEPIGKEFTIAGRRLRVAGVVERRGSIFGQSQDNFIWIPITTFRKIFSGRRSIVIRVEARSMDALATAQEQCRAALRLRRRLDFGDPDDFSIETGESVMDLWQTATRNIYIVTFVVTAISLIVGGIVVMNIMLVSVAERVREIGVRKALGARRRDIRNQFLVEAMILTLAGGVLGILGAALFSSILAYVLGRIMSVDFTAPVRLWAVTLALAVSMIVGLVSGIYPASHAAAHDPVEALRHE